jgi:hypothetical protein
MDAVSSYPQYQSPRQINPGWWLNMSAMVLVGTLLGISIGGVEGWALCVLFVVFVRAVIAWLSREVIAASVIDWNHPKVLRVPQYRAL